MARVLMPLPDVDFDTTEVSVPWRLLKDAGHDVVFATEHGGTAPKCDPRLLSGVLFGQLGADPEPKEFYAQLEKDPAFNAPMAWKDVDVAAVDGLILAGGHAPGMRQYLASTVLQQKVAEFVGTGKPLGAICHGVLVLARTKDPTTGRSVLHNRQTTCLPYFMEALAYGLTFWKLGRYYRTYDAYVEEEVRAALLSPTQFRRGPLTVGTRGSSTNDTAAFVVEDGNYVSARWPGDAYLFARRFISRLPAAR